MKDDKWHKFYSVAGEIIVGSGVIFLGMGLLMWVVRFWGEIVWGMGR